MKKSLKNLICVVLSLIMLLNLTSLALAAGADPTATVSGRSLVVNGKESACEKYKINGDDYFKLRDLAVLLNGTGSQFAVEYDGNSHTIIVESGKAYTPVGGELAVGEDKSFACAESDWKLLVNGKEVAASVYRIGGNNYFRLRDLSEALNFQVIFAEGSNTDVVTSQEKSLMVGAGAGEIVFDPAMFPTEGFDGTIHDSPYVRVLLFENGEKVAFVTADMVTVSDNAVPVLRELVSEKTGVPVENVWIAATHAITTPHEPSGKGGGTLSAEGVESAGASKSEMYLKSLTDATSAAVDQAIASFQPAVMGIGTGECDINVNRNIETPEGVDGGPYYGLGGTGYSDKLMTIVRFDSLDGEPIGFYLSYGVKPTAIDNSEQKAGTRVVSTDVSGMACAMVEEEYGAPCMFAMPAAGDQYPREMALYYGFDEDGNWLMLDKGVAAGLEMVERLGTEMGNAAVGIAGAIDCTISNAAVQIGEDYVTATLFDKGQQKYITSDYPVSAITVGDVAFVGVMPEFDAISGTQLREASPYGTTLMVSFLVSLNSKGQYVPHDAAYDYNDGVGTYEVSRASVVRGTAEQIIDLAVNLLDSLKND